MNMLIGVLVEAISAVAEKERMAIQISIVESVLRDIFHFDLEQDNPEDALIGKDELAKVVKSRAAVVALEELGIDVVGLVETADHIFENNVGGEIGYTRHLSFNEFMEVLLQLRGSNKATVKDIVELKKFVNKVLKSIDKVKIQMAKSADDIEQMQGKQKKMGEMQQIELQQIAMAHADSLAVFAPLADSLALAPAAAEFTVFDGDVKMQVPSPMRTQIPLPSPEGCSPLKSKTGSPMKAKIQAMTMSPRYHALAETGPVNESNELKDKSTPQLKESFR